MVGIGAAMRKSRTQNQAGGTAVGKKIHLGMMIVDKNRRERVGRAPRQQREAAAIPCNTAARPLPTPCPQHRSSAGVLATPERLDRFTRQCSSASIYPWYFLSVICILSLADLMTNHYPGKFVLLQ
mmetsp:Transcript_18680/g.31231  ORF Transcript_18680/g.31231 Transcript_18680/m.31231 type:complete len:126 (-) Transcript_18680:49-426(-)